MTPHLPVFRSPSGYADGRQQRSGEPAPDIAQPSFRRSLSSAFSLLERDDFLFVCGVADADLSAGRRALKQLVIVISGLCGAGAALALGGFVGQFILP
jgi:hypothetical protein